MRQALTWMMVALLCYTAEAVSGEREPSDPLLEAQAAYDKAVTLYEAGQYGAALTQGEQALALAEAVLDGSGDPAVANSLDLLGILHGLQGEFAQAEPLHQRALALRDEVLGPNDPDVAASLTNLANLYYAQASYTRAEPLYLRALAIREELLGKNHPDVAASLNNLANLYYAQRLPAQAESLHQRALAIWEETLGRNHPHVAQSLNNLANLYYSQGLYRRAEPLYARALAIREATLGKSHPDVAASLNNLASLYDAQGFYTRAEPLLQRARTIWESAFRKDHPNMVPTLNNLAQFHVAQHRLADAVSLFTQAFSISERRLRQEALAFSEARLTRFLEQLRSDEELLYSLLRAYPENEDVRRLVLSVVLLLKGRSAGELANTSHAVYRSLGPLDRHIFQQLRELRSQLATLVLQGPGSHPLGYQQRLDALAAQDDALEADLAQRSAPLRALTALPALSKIVHQVAMTLPPDGALVEFIAYTERSLVVKPAPPGSEAPLQQRYLAMVLLPNAHIRAIDLGPAEPIDRAALGLRDALARRDATFQASAQALYPLAFQPLLPLPGNPRRIFLSPDGQLGLVPFAALHDGQQFLIDTYDFIYLTSGKDLLPRSQVETSHGEVVVLADPDFHVPLPTPPAPEDAPPLTPRFLGFERFFYTPRAELAERPWVPLPGTRQEAEAIQRLFPKAQVFLGPEATKQRLLHLPTPAVLHIATHGFFLKDVTVPENSRAVGHFGALDEGAPAHRSPDPLLRSGLILMETPPQSSRSPGAPSPPMGIAWVTALELAGLDLWGTQLVVLSACDTGRGDIRLGQGVYGLRRAFVVAGAETVVMSLWMVNDETTRTLMEAYYRALLAGQGRATALREAMRELRLTQPHPHYWAPFIAMGQNTPLRLPAPQPRGPGRSDEPQAPGQPPKIGAVHPQFAGR
ncbi:CHAT domain-containing protein [Stigmatella sp. ncwal1]|uniref:CHAT domain-containing protein n=1 Tax=Stigmatella ashevillensis TaxID=2995309 RepID=A0ABT5DPY2_9BACT|nr:CHAT domain-containing tetratricopeptide repeat protein [Stigmatella ashevillena]MDC0715205.1 CHAT domain-containing protein [Stigmatella ashevillena]